MCLISFLYSEKKNPDVNCNKKPVSFELSEFQMVCQRIKQNYIENILFSLANAESILHI